MLRKIRRTRRNKDIVLFLLFFGFASLLWYGHAMQSVRNTHVPVAIHYIGKPGNIGLGEEGLPDKVTIEVRDAGHRLNSYHQHPLQLTIDLHPYIHGDTGTIHIPANDLRSGIKAILQDNSNLINTEPEQLRCSYFKEHEKRVVVAFDGTIVTADGYQVIGEPMLSRPQIKIYGRQQVLQAIDTIRTEPIERTNVTDPIELRAALVLPQGVRADLDSIDIAVQTEMFTEKRFTIPIEALHVPKGYEVHLFPEKAEVNVRIGMSHAAQLQESDLRVYCIFPLIPKRKLELTLDHSANPHITSAWVYPTEVEYLLEQ